MTDTDAKSTPLVTDTNESADGAQTTTTTTTTVSDHPTPWHNSPLDICSAGLLGCIMCCICPSYNYCRSMIIMDNKKDPLLECIKSICCCCCMQRIEMRRVYNIEGFEIEDCLCTCFCYSCVSVQMLAESRIRNGLQHAPLVGPLPPPQQHHHHGPPGPGPFGPGPRGGPEGPGGPHGPHGGGHHGGSHHRGRGGGHHGGGGHGHGHGGGRGGGGGGRGRGH